MDFTRDIHSIRTGLGQSTELDVLQVERRAAAIQTQCRLQDFGVATANLKGFLAGETGTFDRALFFLPVELTSLLNVPPQEDTLSTYTDPRNIAYLILDDDLVLLPVAERTARIAYVQGLIDSAFGGETPSTQTAQTGLFVPLWFPYLAIALFGLKLAAGEPKTRKPTPTA